MYEVSRLCGGPGLFAPEIILWGDKKYNGYAEDTCPIVCVMLEKAQKRT